MISWLYILDNQLIDENALKSVAYSAGYGISSMILCFVTFTVIWHYRLAYSPKYRKVREFEYIKKVPVLGHGMFLQTDPVAFLKQVNEIIGYQREKYPEDQEALLWMSPFHPAIVCYTNESLKFLMSNSEYNDKSVVYEFFNDWLGKGLLTASKDKWKSRRKLLTPAFHSEILNDFSVIMNKHSRTLVKLIYKQIQDSPNGYADINMFNRLTLSALDVICETAMGTEVHAQAKPDSPYILSIYKACPILMNRIIHFYLWPDFIFKYFSGQYEDYKACLTLLKTFTSNILDKKIDQRQNNQENPEHLTASDKKSRKSFIDILLDKYESNEISYKGILEEVDTFMFEGHDTTSSAMTFATTLLSQNSGYQKKAQEEIDEKLQKINIENDFIKNVDLFQVGTSDYDRLEFLEASSKETLRLYPSVPFFSRQVYHGFLDSTMYGMVPYTMHRDKQIWGDNSNEFRPERFYKNKENELRDPFKFLAFSAGSRNCIGKRFALMEMKTTLSYLFKFFTFKCIDTKEEVEDKLSADIILKPRGGVKIRVALRENYEHEE